MTAYLYKLATDKYRGFLFWPLKGFLYVLSLIYGLVVISLRAIYRLRPSSLGAKVISVGNITLGGTGKTPLVEYLARSLSQRGEKVAILTRGYRSTAPKQVGIPVMGDEPLMLGRNLEGVPVIVNPDRKAGAKEAREKYGASTLILDDGFQQWGIKKDLEIVVVDATSPFGNRHLLPRGILREPPSSLRRADILVLTKTNLAKDTAGLKKYLQQINPAALLVGSRHTAINFYALGNRDDLLPLRDLEARKAALVCGIGDPASFEKLVKRLGIDIALSLRFPDHYLYSKQDFADIALQCRAKYIDIVVTTEKDAARLNQELIKECGLRVMVLKMQLELTENAEGFIQRLSSLYSS